MKAAAYCPGHITGFFLPCLNEDPLRSGSRGAGFCVSLGAATTVTAEDGNGGIKVLIDGRPDEAPVTRSAASFLLKDRKLDLKIETSLDLPVGAGFGMSAAGALSTSFALAEILELGPEDAFAAAHLAELTNRSGLGDVPALFRGGVTFRRSEGLPPYGVIDRLASDLEVVAAVVGPSVRTADVLADPVQRERILRAGQECYERLARRPTVDEFFAQSRRFTARSGIATPLVREALKALDGLGDASMIMLGNAVFARGDLDAIERVLSSYGHTYRLSLDTVGPRVLVSER
jgi:pantoate kinase